jgi:hypothetical protein
MPGASAACFRLVPQARSCERGAPWREIAAHLGFAAVAFCKRFKALPLRIDFGHAPKPTRRPLVPIAESAPRLVSFSSIPDPD